MPDDLQNFNHAEARFYLFWNYSLFFFIFGDRWVSDDQQIEIGAGLGVRVRIMNLRIDSNKIFAVGTIKVNLLPLYLARRYSC